MRQRRMRWRKPPAIAPPSEVRADPGRQRLNVNWRDSVRDEDLELALDDDVLVSKFFVVDGSLY